MVKFYLEHSLLIQCLSMRYFFYILGVDKEWLHQVLSQPAGNTKTYSILIIEKLLQIVNMSSQQSKILSELCRQFNLSLIYITVWNYRL